MNRQLSRLDLLFLDSLFIGLRPAKGIQALCQGGCFPVSDHPAHDVAAEDIEDDIMPTWGKTETVAWAVAMVQRTKNLLVVALFLTLFLPIWMGVISPRLFPQVACVIEQSDGTITKAWGEAACTNNDSPTIVLRSRQ